MKWLDECPTSRRNGIQEVQGSGVAADRTPLYMQGHLRLPSLLFCYRIEVPEFTHVPFATFVCTTRLAETPPSSARKNLVALGRTGRRGPSCSALLQNPLAHLAHLVHLTHLLHPTYLCGLLWQRVRVWAYRIGWLLTLAGWLIVLIPALGQVAYGWAVLCRLCHQPCKHWRVPNGQQNSNNNTGSSGINTFVCAPSWN